MAKKITPESLRSELLDFVINTQYPHDDLDSLASVTRITGISDLEIDSVESSADGESSVEGTASVDVELEYGSGEDTTTNAKSFPLAFNLIVDEDGSITKGKTTIDTSSFYGNPQDE